MAKPKLLLLDEPSLGLAPMIVESIFQVIQSLNREQNLTILLVEQNVQVSLSIANRAYVLDVGRITLEGDAELLLNNPQVKEIYLGELKV